MSTLERESRVRRVLRGPRPNDSVRTPSADAGPLRYRTRRFVNAGETPFTLGSIDRTSNLLGRRTRP